METVYGQDGAIIGIEDDDLPIGMDSDARGEKWHRGIPLTRKRSEALSLNEIIATYRKAFAALVTVETRRRINKDEPFGMAAVEDINTRTERMHWYRRGLVSLEPYVVRYADKALNKEVERIIRTTEWMLK